MDKQKIDINTYKFQSGQTIAEILKSQTSWRTDRECLENLVRNNIRNVSDFADDKDRQALGKIDEALQNPDTDLRMLAVESDVATHYMCVKHFDQNAMNEGKRPYLTNVVNVSAQDDFPYELPDWLEDDLEEYPLREEEINLLIHPDLSSREDILLDSEESIDARICSENLRTFCDEQLFEEASILNHDEILKKYGDVPVPIGIIPNNDPIFNDIWKDVKDSHVYTGKGSFIDHWVNHHPEMESEDFLKLQEVLTDPNNRYIDEKKNAVIFQKKYENYNDVVVLKKAKDRLIYERSNYLPEKLPKRWINLNEINTEKIMSFVDGHPTISQSNKIEAGIVRNISALNDTLNITPKKESNQVIEELNVWIEKAEKDNKRIQELTETVEEQNKIIQKQNQLLYGNTNIDVNGKTRNFPKGLVAGTPKCIEKLDEANQKILKLNSIIQSQQKSNHISPKSPSDDGGHSY